MPPGAWNVRSRFSHPYDGATMSWRGGVGAEPPAILSEPCLSSFQLKFRNKCNFSWLQVTRVFIKISLVGTTEMREILVTRRVSGRWL